MEYRADCHTNQPKMANATIMSTQPKVVNNQFSRGPTRPVNRVNRKLAPLAWAPAIPKYTSATSKRELLSTMPISATLNRLRSNASRKMDSIMGTTSLPETSAQNKDSLRSHRAGNIIHVFGQHSAQYRSDRGTASRTRRCGRYSHQSACAHLHCRF